MSRAQVVWNTIPQAQARIEEAVHAKTIEATDLLGQFIAASLEAGQHGLKSDRHALAKSLYVEATGRDDYDRALDAAREAFAAKPASEKEKASFASLVATRSALPERGAHVFVCALSTMLAYGTWWETDGGRPWMTTPAYEWASSQAQNIFAELRAELR